MPKYKGKDRRKPQPNVEFWNIKMGARTFITAVSILCVTALLLFSFAFSVNILGFQCGNKPQPIPRKAK
jgi:hypothetical protein